MGPKDRNRIPLPYIKQQASQQYEFLFCVEIPWPLLSSWSELLEGTSITTSDIDVLKVPLTPIFFFFFSKRIHNLVKIKKRTE